MVHNWWNNLTRRRTPLGATWRCHRPFLELLEDRTLLSAGDSITNAIPIAFHANNTASVTQHLAAGNQVQLESLSLAAGDTVTAAVSTQAYGSGLDSSLRIFDSNGQQIATNNDFTGHDPQLTFQAPVAGTYYIGVSAFDNITYDPAGAQSGHGSSTGLFDLRLSKANRALLLDLAGASFQVSSSTAVVGDQLNITYTVENRGGAATGTGFNVDFYASAANTIGVADGTVIATRTLGPLAAGQAFTETFAIVQPAATAGQRAYLGLSIDRFNAIPEANERNNDSSPEHGNDWEAVLILAPQTAGEANENTATAASIVLDSRTTGTITASDNADFVKFTLTENGRLTAKVHAAAGLDTRLSLYDANGLLLIQSDGQSPSHRDDLIVQFLEGSSAGTPYYLKLEGIQQGTGDYALTTEFSPATMPGDPLPVVGVAVQMVLADFNGDGLLDLATNNFFQDHHAPLTIYSGLGDGTFDPHGASMPVGHDPAGLAAGDFNGDGWLDLAVANAGDRTVTIFKNDGDGTFKKTGTFAVGNGPAALVTGDFNGDGILDLATANFGLAANPSNSHDISSKSWDIMFDTRRNTSTSNDISVLLGNGDGTFRPEQRYVTGKQPRSLVAGDFNGDGFLDLATADYGSYTVSLLLNHGDGTFPDRQTFAVGKLNERLPMAVIAGDFNEDGRLDLGAVEGLLGGKNGPDELYLFLGNGNGTFQAARKTRVGLDSVGLVTADLNGDGHLDFAAPNRISQDVSLVLGNGDGTFQAAVSYLTNIQSPALVAGDLNGDGLPDIVTNNHPLSSILLNQGQGTFLTDNRMRVGTGPLPLATDDFNQDGRPDLITASSQRPGVVTCWLGNGDGTFHGYAFTSGATGLVSAVTADFNRDGRKDFALAQYFGPKFGRPGAIITFFGNGDGTFQRQEPFFLQDSRPVALVVADFNYDGIPDLASANFNFGAGDLWNVLQGSTGGLNDAQSTASTVSIIFGSVDGTFHGEKMYGVGIQPKSLVAGDFDNDGTLDLVVANYLSDDLSILLGKPDGTFQAARQFVDPLLFGPSALVARDLDSDGKLDLAVAEYASADTEEGANFPSYILFLKGDGQGSFSITDRVLLGNNRRPRNLTVGDFDKDGMLDIAAANLGTFPWDPYPAPREVAILSGDGHGKFQLAQTIPLGGHSVVASDFNGDGHLDLAATHGSAVNIFLGAGDGTFYRAGLTANAIQATPLLVDFTGDGVADVAVLRRDGRILLRKGRAGQPGAYDPAIIINPIPVPFDATQDFPARDLAIIRRKGHVVLAALDNKGSISLYSFNKRTGKFVRTAGPTVPGVWPVRIVSGDLNRDGRDDLVVTAALSNQVFVFLQDAKGNFGAAPNFQATTGASPYTIQLADMDGDKRPDIIVANQFSGDVSVLLNKFKNPFVQELRFRAGAGLYGVGSLLVNNSSTTVRSQEGTVAVVAGRFNGDLLTDLLAINSGSGFADLLLGNGSGGVFNPRASSSIDVGKQSTAARAADFNRDGKLDLAVLNEKTGTITILLGDGQGNFTFTATVDAGSTPTGLSVGDANRDRIPDLLVGNTFGDVLTILGNGDGSFRPPQRVGKGIPLAVTQVNGEDVVVLGNESLDQIKVLPAGQLDGTGMAAFQGRQDGVQGPGAVQLFDLNKDGIKDLIVANGGSNNVLVYPGLADGGYGPEFNGGKGFFTGTNPVGVTMADVNADTISDLVVANKGSNDVSILFGKLSATTWTATTGPRLNTGGVGPNSTTVQDVNNDGKADILVTNSQSNTVGLIPGVGGGFFNDVNPALVPVGAGPSLILPLLTSGDSRFATINAASNNITLFQFTAATFQFEVLDSVSSGGVSPNAALAGDFNHDGFSDLVVANHGDGMLSLLLGDSHGLSPFQAFEHGDLPHPSNLALSDTESGVFYASSDGSERAVRLEFDFSFPDFVPAVAQLQSVLNSDVAIVATLVHGSVAELVFSDTNLAFPEAGLSTFVIGLTTQPLVQVPEAESGIEDPEVTTDDVQDVSGKNGTLSPLDMYLLDVERALEQARPAEVRNLIDPKTSTRSLDRLFARLVAQTEGDAAFESLGVLLTSPARDAWRTIATTAESIAWPEVVQDLGRDLLDVGRCIIDALHETLREQVPSNVPDADEQSATGILPVTMCRLAPAANITFADLAGCVGLMYGLWHDREEEERRYSRQ